VHGLCTMSATLDQLLVTTKQCYTIWHGPAAPAANQLYAAHQHAQDTVKRSLARCLCHGTKLLVKNGQAMTRFMVLTPRNEAVNATACHKRQGAQAAKQQPAHATEVVRRLVRHQPT
jgi:hypothetical protein